MIWIVGGDGGIGLRLSQACRTRGFAHLASSRRKPSSHPGAHLDLGDTPEKWRLPDGCGTLILAAAITKLSECEAAPAATRLINVERTVLLAAKAMAAGWRVVFLSTGAVFDGSIPFVTEDIAPTPCSAYAEQKVAAEQHLMELGSSISIVRLSKVLEPASTIFSEWATDLRLGKAIHPLSDLLFCPVCPHYVAEELISLANSDRTGIFHLGGAGELSYAEGALFLARFLKCSEELVQSRTQKERAIHKLQKGPHTTLGRRRSDFPSLPPPSIKQTLHSLFRDL